MSAKQERELFLVLCSTLEARPIDCDCLAQIVSKWREFEFDVDFAEFAEASKTLDDIAALVDEVRKFHFLTDYIGTTDLGSLPAPDTRPTCLQALQECLEGSGNPRLTHVTAKGILTRHTSAARAALDAHDEDMLKTYLKWNAEGAALSNSDPTLAAEIKAWLAQQHQKRSDWISQLNDGSVPDDLGLSSFQAELLVAANAKHSSRAPMLVDQDVFKWAQVFEEHTLQTITKVLSYSSRDFVRHLENAVQFGATLFITDFTGPLPELDDIIWDALAGQCMKVGSLNMVRIGDSIVEFASGFRRYLVTATPDLQLPPEAESRVLRMDRERRVLQICHLGTDADKLAVLSCTTVGGTELARLQLSLSDTDVGGALAAVGKQLSLDPLEFDIIFPNAVSSRGLSRSRLLSELLLDAA